ncbi:MAG: ATP-grasp domain-containing protein [Methylotenera sp.]
MSIASKPYIIIAAISSRIYVEAAVKAGYDVIAIDAFADTDVKKLAKKSFQVGLVENQLDSKQLIEILHDLDLQHILGLCYGAGFERNTNLLREINKRLRVLGNPASVVDDCKLPAKFFATCKQLLIPFPEVAKNPPLLYKDWLAKRVGNSGGSHIKLLVDAPVSHNADMYYQKQIRGMPISCLFIASKHGVDVIGVNEQWLDSSNTEPYRYGGAVSHADINPKAKLRLIGYVKQLAVTLGLIGLNSCDAICVDEDVYVLEINPRLSATMDLYRKGNLMEKHIAASLMTLKLSEIALSNNRETSFAHQIVYATNPLKTKSDIIWPEWARDVPSAGAQFYEGMPVCTVIAEAETPALAKALVADRASTLKRKFLN